MGKESFAGTFGEAISQMATYVEKKVERVEKIKGKKPEIVVSIIYLLGQIIVSIFHEPWFDEALAWMISKTSSIPELVMEVPHYEGHPGLWHLVLFPFAKMGFPYELSLSLVSIVFAGTAVLFLIWKSPFKRVVRLLLPFTYFMFYQYSVISRPYCMMMLALVILAMTYKNKFETPWKYVLAMLFLCSTSAYGLVISGGLAIAWLVEIWYVNSDKRIKSYITFIWKKKIFIPLLGLLIYALFLIIRIMPRTDTFATVMANSAVSSNSVFIRLIYSFFSAISDSFLTNTFYQDGTLRLVEISIIELVISSLLGLLIFIFVLRSIKSRFIKITFVIPYVLVAICFGVMYASRHHIGIFMLYVVFILWVSYADGEKEIDTDNSRKLSYKYCVLGVTLCMIIPIYWSVSSCVLDIMYPYSSGRNEYKYLETEELLKESILADWNKPIGEVEDNAIFFSRNIVTILPYMKEDVFINSLSNLGWNYKLFHKVPIKEQNDEWKNDLQMITPKLLVGETDLHDIYNDGRVSINDYQLVYSNQSGTIWKGVPLLKINKIYKLIN